MTVRVYKSTDDGAPVLNGLDGSLITVLDAVLVNGYGTMAAAGWTKPYSATKTAVYRNSVTGGTGTYYKFEDLIKSGSNGRYCYYRGFETMSSVSTGTNPFPSMSATDGLEFSKSSTNDSTVRSWTIIADQYSVYLIIDIDGSGYHHLLHFGDMYSFINPDLYRCLISGPNDFWRYSIGLRNSPVKNIYMPRSYSQTGTVIQPIISANGVEITRPGNLNADMMLSGAHGITYPHPIDGKLHMSKCFIGEQNLIRGYLRGFRYSLHPRPLSSGDIFYGTDSTAGKTFQCFKCKGNIDPSSPATLVDGQFYIEVSDTWEVTA